MFRKYGIGEDELGPQFINDTLSSIEGSDYVFLIKETKGGGKRLGFRVRREGFDVSKLARCFGGGGHTKSSGANTDLSIEEISKIIEETDIS